MPFSCFAEQTSYTTKKLIKYVGETVDLDCCVTGSFSRTMEWRMIHRSCSSYDTLSVNNIVKRSIQPRCEIHHVHTNTTTSSYTLRIKDLQESDTATYQCLKNYADDIVAQVELSVLRPLIITISQDQFVNTDATVELNCSLNRVNNHSYSVIWTKKEHEYLTLLSIGSEIMIKNPQFAVHINSNASASTFTLRIKNVSEIDAGTYQCKVYSPETKKSLSFDTKLTVLNLPFITNSPKQSKYIGGMAEFDCTVKHSTHMRSYPVAWSMNKNNEDIPILLSVDSVPMNTDPRFEIELATNSSLTVFKLRIKDIKESDAGIYKCQLLLFKSFKNLRKSDNSACSVDVELTIRQQPATVFPKTQKKFVGEAYEVNCTVNHDSDHSNDAVVWMKKGSERSLENHVNDSDARLAMHRHYYSKTSTYVHTLQIKDVQQNDAGVYQCKVHLQDNKKFTVDTDLSVVGPPTVLVSSKQVKNIGDTVKLNCSVVGNFDGFKKVSWFRKRMNDDSLKLLSIGIYKKISNPRMAVQYDSSSSTYILQINDVQVLDAGIYQCELEASVKILNQEKMFELSSATELSIHQSRDVEIPQEQIKAIDQDVAENFV